jgi:hypothetical protein
MSLGNFAVLSDNCEPVPFELYEPGVYLHGAKADLAPGELLVAGRESNFEAGELVDWVGHSPEKLEGMRSGLQRIERGRIED